MSWVHCLRAPGPDPAEPDTSPSYPRTLAVEAVISFSHAKNQDHVRALAETSFTTGNACALGLSMTVRELITKGIIKFTK
jgi:hypothetical protein